MKPVISVVIPAYNEENYLPKCLKSVFNQDFAHPFEVIVVDNNSTDQTAQIAHRFRCRVLKESRQGIVFAKQTGCTQANGKIIATIDADSIAPPHWLETIYNTLNADPEIAACGGNAFFPSLPWLIASLWKIKDLLVVIIYRLTGKALYIPGTNFAFKKRVFDQLGGYNTKFSWAADEFDLVYRLQKNHRLIYHPRLLVTSSARRVQGRLLQAIFEGIVWYIFNLAIYYLTGKVIVNNPPAVRQIPIPLYRRRPAFVFIPLFTLVGLLAIYLFSINSASPTLAKVKNRLEPIVEKLKDNLTPTTNLLKQP